MNCEMFDKLMDDLKAAMKAHDMVAVNAIRGVIAKVKDLPVNAGKDMTDDAVMSVVAIVILFIVNNMSKKLKEKYPV